MDDLAARQHLLGRAIYGGVLYITLLVVMAAEEPPAGDLEAVLILGVSAIVYWSAHAYAAIVPALARSGRFDREVLGRAALAELPILVAAVIPMVPLGLHALGWIGLETAYLDAVLLTLTTLIIVVLVEGHRAGLSRPRTLLTAGLVVLVGVLVLILELAIVH